LDDPRGAPLGGRRIVVIVPYTREVSLEIPHTREVNLGMTNPNKYDNIYRHYQWLIPREPMSKDHLFKKGQPSANPLGRPKGQPNKYTELSKQLLSEKGPEIVQMVIQKALEGDVTCLKMCMDRIVPAQKAIEVKHENQDMAINIVVESIGQAATKAISQNGYNVSQIGIVDAEIVESEDGDF